MNNLMISILIMVNWNIDVFGEVTNNEDIVSLDDLDKDVSEDILGDKAAPDILNDTTNDSDCIQPCTVQALYSSVQYQVYMQYT